jgi:uncharacterized damage-inducible protein DinB
VKGPTRLVTGSIRPFYADWADYNRRVVDAIRPMSRDDLALRAPNSNHWPIWAIVGHMAAMRVFWLCHVFGEPGAELTAFEGDAPGWEDDLARPRSAEELSDALTSTWQVVDGCLLRWTPDSLDRTARRDKAGRVPEIHTRQSVLMRMITHEAYHVGEVNLALSAGGREPIDLWPASDWESPETSAD